MNTGLFIAFFSFLALIFQVYLYLLRPDRVPGWTSLYSLVTMIGGVQLVFLGVIGEYIGQIYEVKGRPTYLIDQVYKKN